MADATTSHSDDAGDVALRAELRWAAIVLAIVALLVAMMAYMSLHWATMPAVRVETVDPTTLHLAGEFTEENLGTALEADGSATVRVVAQQYSFTPQCLVVPADTPVTIRATSADVIHGFLINQTNVNVMLGPGRRPCRSGCARADLAEELLSTVGGESCCGTGGVAWWSAGPRPRTAARARGSRRLTCVG